MLRQLTSAYCFCLIISLTTSQSLSAEQSSCQTVFDREIRCLQSADIAASSSLTSLWCPRNDLDLVVNQVQVFKSSSPADCPATARTAVANSDGSCLLYTLLSTSKLCSLPTCSVNLSPGQNTPIANCFGYNGLPYALITYTCQPRASISMNTSSVAMTLSDNTTFVVSIATISSYNPVLGQPSAADGNRQPPYCSVYIPSSAGQVSVRFTSLEPKPSCLELTDGTSSVLLCGNRTLDQQSMTLPCSNKDQFIRIRPTTSIQSLYSLTVQVNYKSKLTIQCGYPPYPLYPTVTYTSMPTTLLPTTTTTTTMTTSPDKEIDVEPQMTSPMATCFFADYDWNNRNIIIAAVVGSVVAVLSFALGTVVGCICRFCCCHDKRHVTSSTDDVKPSPAAENDYVDITSISQRDQPSAQGGDFGVYSSIRKIPPSADEFAVYSNQYTAC